MIRLIEMMTKKIGSIYQNLLVKIIIIIMMMMMMPKIICVPQSQLLVLSAHLCPTTLKIGPHHTSQDNTLLLLLWFTHHTSQDTTPWLLLLFTHHKTPPYHNSIHTFNTILIIYCLINNYIRWIPNVKMCTSEAVELSKHVHLWKQIFRNSTKLSFWADSLVPSLDGAGSVNVNARNLPSDEVCKESLISSAA